jgi:ABC-type polysaccharide/polyol phosphate export permease
MSVAMGFADLGRGIGELWLSARLANNEMAQRYARSIIGPFWITITQGLYAAVLGVLVSGLFNQEPAKILPIIVVGMIVWNFMTGILLDSCYSFSANRQHLLNTDIPFSTFINLTVFRHTLVFLHHLVAAVAVFLLFRVQIGPEAWKALFAIPPIVICAYGLAMFAAPIAARYRDMVSLIQSVIIIGGIVTPVWWLHDFVKTRREIVEFNPLAYMIEAVRSPLLGTPPMENALLIAWITSLLVLALGCAVFVSFRRTIALWI